MAVLHISPESSALVHAAANTVLVLHISGGGVGILSGAAALVFRKGERLHRLAGNVFFVAMLTMSGIGAVVAPMLPERLSSLAGAVTFYLVATSWATVKRKEGTVGRFEPIALMAALCVAAAGVVLGLEAEKLPKGELDGYPAVGHYVLAGLLAFAATLDLTVILRGGITGAQRIARHLWRMCVALFFAVGSLFLGQSQLFPAFIRASNILLVPEILVIGALIFWLAVTGFTRRFRQGGGATNVRPPLPA